MLKRPLFINGLLLIIFLISIFISGCSGGDSGGDITGGIAFDSNFDARGYIRSSSTGWNNGTPLEGVRVSTDTEKWTLTANNGYFLIKDVENGTRTFTFKNEQHESMQMKVRSYGEDTTIKAQVPCYKTLENRARLRVDVESYNENFHRSLYCSEIHVTKEGDGERKWSAYWDDDQYNSIAIFDGVEKGATYKISITWRGYDTEDETRYLIHTIADAEEDVVNVWGLRSENLMPPSEEKSLKEAGEIKP